MCAEFNCESIISYKLYGNNEMVIKKFCFNYLIDSIKRFIKNIINVSCKTAATFALPMSVRQNPPFKCAYIIGKFCHIFQGAFKASTFLLVYFSTTLLFYFYYLYFLYFFYRSLRTFCMLK